LYFSRSPIPAAGHGLDAADVCRSAWRHLGLYAYRPVALQTLSTTEASDLETFERLEQLRALSLGMTIMIAADDAEHGPDVDTKEDLAAVERILGCVD